MRGGDFSWPQAGTFAGHQWGPHLATSGDLFMATDISATDEIALVKVHFPAVSVIWSRVLRRKYSSCVRG